MLSYANKIAIYRRTFNRKKIPNFAAKMNDGNFKNSEDKNQNLQIFGQGFATFEIIANHMREEQEYYLQQMERYHINFHDLKRVAHIGPELYERFLYSIVSEHKLKVIHMAIQLILREGDLREKENMHPRGHREKEFLDSYRDFLFSKSIAEMDDYIESVNQKYQIIQNSNFVSIINELIQCKAIHLNINYLPKHK